MAKEMATQIIPPLQLPPTNDHDLIIKIDANVENFIQTLNTYISNTNREMADRENRLRVVEKSLTDTRAEIKGARRTVNIFLAVLPVVGGVIGGLVEALILHGGLQR